MATDLSQPIPEETYLRLSEASQFVRVSQSCLNKMRMFGTGPVYLKPSKRIVLYKRSDLVAWLEAGRRTSTSDPGEARP